MDIEQAARGTAKLIILSNDLPENHPEYGKDHLRYMCQEIILGRVSGEKAHRWLGWIQACVCIGAGANLEQLKLINFKS